VLPKHGFARNRAWHLLRSDDDADGHASLVLGLSDDAATHALWPHRFALELRLRLRAQALEMTLHCINPGPDPWSFAAALHTYLRVSDSARIRVAGLSGRPFHDAVDGQDKTQHDTWLTIPGEVDRVYAGVDTAVDLHDPGAGGTGMVRVEHSGFSDTVVWNPGAQRCAGLPDMPANGYRSMVCIESGRIIAPVLLAPAQSWAGTQRLHLRA
jgi:glucose-6-phosphate 1-epimerase